MKQERLTLTSAKDERIPPDTSGIVMMRAVCFVFGRAETCVVEAYLGVFCGKSRRMLIGVTGGIGMGKSTVLRDFGSFGASVLDADDIAHSLYEPGREAYEAMVARWGTGVLDEAGRMHRQRVGERVFGDARELQWLNELLHPLIRGEMRRLAGGPREPVYVAVPLLYESGWVEDFACVVAVWCPAEVQHRRLLARGWSEEEITRRLGKQLSADEKLRRADYAVLTDCDWGLMREQCALIHSRICDDLSSVVSHGCP